MGKAVLPSDKYSKSFLHAVKDGDGDLLFFKEDCPNCQ